MQLAPVLVESLGLCGCSATESIISEGKDPRDTDKARTQTIFFWSGIPMDEFKGDVERRIGELAGNEEMTHICLGGARGAASV